MKSIALLISNKNNAKSKQIYELTSKIKIRSKNLKLKHFCLKINHFYNFNKLRIEITNIL